METWKDILLSVLILATIYKECSAASVCAPITDQVASKTENGQVELVCELNTHQPNSVINWIHPNGEIVSRNCDSKSSKYSVKCSPTNAPTKYTLVFKVSWEDRGKFTCKCDSTGLSGSTKLTVKVPPKFLTATCIVQSTGGACNETSRKGSDVLQFNASVGCTYPSSSITWSDDQGIPISTADYGGVFKKTPCTDDNKDQISATSNFKASWSDLGKTTKVNVAAANEVGGLYFELPIHKPAEKEDTTAVVIGSVLAVLLFLIVLGLVVFLVVRYKKLKKEKEEKGKFVAL